MRRLVVVVVVVAGGTVPSGYYLGMYAIAAGRDAPFLQSGSSRRGMEIRVRVRVTAAPPIRVGG